LLDQPGSLVRDHARQFPFSMMTLTEAELLGSCDVFPVKFLGVREFHAVLAGKECLSDLPIHSKDLRLRCEQEVKNLMLRLRNFYLYRGDLTPLLRGTLVDAARAFLHTAEGMLYLHDGEMPPNRDALLSKLAETFEIDPNVPREVLRLQPDSESQSTVEIDEKKLRALYGQFADLVTHVAERIDQFEEDQQ
ncbi:MAG: hypothetical protein N2C14_00305, partial [Planctomycetales bacterium]